MKRFRALCLLLTLSLLGLTPQAFAQTWQVVQPQAPATESGESTTESSGSSGLGRYQTTCSNTAGSSGGQFCVRTDTLTGATSCVYNSSGIYPTGTWSTCPAPFGGSSFAGGSGVSEEGIQLGGFFVLTGASWNGNLGGLTGANEKCLTELSDHPWNGKGTAGDLTADRVKAFLCDSSSCQNLQPYTQYTFATARDVSAGGGSFTTDMDGRGPGDSNAWSSYFGGGSFSYWTGRAAGSPTLWANTVQGNSCSNWTSTGFNGHYGRSLNSHYIDARRWAHISSGCVNSYRLICIVEPN